MPSSASIPSPSGSGERNSAASSTRSAARKAADRIGPASTITRVIPRPASARSTAARSSCPLAPGTRSTSTPACVSRLLGSGRAAASTNTQSSVRVAESASFECGGSRNALSSTTRTGELCSIPGRRQVSCGSSASTVPMPVSTASFIARIWCTRVRAASPVIAAGLRPGSPALPSADTASFSVTCGRPSRTRRKCPACARKRFLAARARHPP